jgi:hypothetical protein
MKYFSLSCALIMSLTSGASAISITDYVTPISRLFDMDLSLSYNLVNQDSIEVNNGLLGLQMINFYESEIFGWRFQGTTELNYDGLREQDKTAYLVDLRYDFHRYFTGDFFGYTSLNLNGETNYDHLKSSVFVGAGYGRYINATAMATALRIQEELQEGEIITGDLEDEVIIKLATAIDTKGQYELERDYFQVLQDILESSDKIETLSGIGFYRMTRVLNSEIIHDRYYGYNVGAGVGYEISNAYSDDTNDPAVEIFGNFSYPFNLRNQLNSSARYTTSLTDFGKSSTFIFSTGYSFELSDRIDNITTYTLSNSSSLINDTEQSSTSHSLINTFRYYIENKISLNLNFQIQKPDSEEVIESLSLSLGYDIL